jgi:hypothetical protein
VIFFEFGRENWTPAINAWKAVAGLTLIQLCLVFTISCWLGYLMGAPVSTEVPTPVVYVIAALLGILNYHFLVTQRQGTNYEQEFYRLPSRSKIFLSVCGIAVIILSLGSAIASALIMRQRLLH